MKNAVSYMWDVTVPALTFKVDSITVFDRLNDNPSNFTFDIALYPRESDC